MLDRRYSLGKIIWDVIDDGYSCAASIGVMINSILGLDSTNTFKKDISRYGYDSLD